MHGENFYLETCHRGQEKLRKIGKICLSKSQIKLLISRMIFLYFNNDFFLYLFLLAYFSKKKRNDFFFSRMKARGSLEIGDQDTESSPLGVSQPPER